MSRAPESEGRMSREVDAALRAAPASKGKHLIETMLGWMDQDGKEWAQVVAAPASVAPTHTDLMVTPESLAAPSEPERETQPVAWGVWWRAAEEIVSAHVARADAIRARSIKEGCQVIPLYASPRGAEEQTREPDWWVVLDRSGNPASESRAVHHNQLYADEVRQKLDEDWPSFAPHSVVGVLRTPSDSGAEERCWLPIEDAPKDGTCVVGYSAIGGASVVRWSLEREWWEWMDRDVGVQPDSFVPLPSDSGAGPRGETT